MPKVPYHGVPTVQATMHPTPYQDIKGITPEAFGADLGKAFLGLGNAIKQAGEVYQAQMDKLDNFNAAKQLNDFNSSENERLIRENREAPLESVNFSQNFMTEHDKRSTAVMESIPPRLRPEYSARLAGLRGRYATQSLTTEFSRRDYYYETEIDKQTGTAASAALNDPSLVDERVANVSESINKSGLPAADKVRLTQKSTLAVVDSAIEGLKRQGRLEEASALRDKYYGSVPRPETAPAVDRKLLTGETAPAPGYAVSRSEVDQYIIESAIRNGVDPNAALRVYRSEGASNWRSQVIDKKTGKLERSYGPFQLYMDGGLGNRFQQETGLDPSDPSTWKQNIDYALKHAAKNGWGDWRGAAKAGMSNFEGIKGEGRAPIMPDAGKAVAWEKDFDAVRTRNARIAVAETQDYSAYLRAGNQRDVNRESELIRRLGPEATTQAQAGIERDAEFGQDVRSLQTAAPQDIDAIIQKYAARLSQPEEFRDNARDYKEINQALEARNNALKNDPAAYATSSSSEVAQARKAYATALKMAPDQAAALGQEYVEIILAEQARLGVAPENRRILTDSMIDDIKGGFSRASGQNIAIGMQEARKQWGRAWPQVFGEMVKGKALTGIEYVVGTMDAPGQERSAEELAEAAKVGRKELEKAFLGGEDSPKTTELRAAVQERLDEFRSTIINNPGGEGTYNTFREATYLLALSRLRFGGSMGDVTGSAVKDILERKYTFVGSYRVPWNHNANTVSRGASQALVSLLPATDVDLPYSPLSPEVTRTQYISALQGNGFWVTAPDESGLVLYEGTGARRAVTSGGRPFVVTWDRLEQMGVGAVVPEPEPSRGHAPPGFVRPPGATTLGPPR